MSTSARARRRLVPVAVAMTLVALAPERTPAQPAPASAAESPREPAPLPPLPRAPSTELPKPEAAELETLDLRLAGLLSMEKHTRDAAARELLEVEPKLVPAIAFRLGSVADKANKQAMKDLLERMRTKARDNERARMRASGDDGEVKTPDYLTILVEQGPGSDDAYRDLASVIGMSRMLTRIGSVEAVRVLIEIYVRFGEFLRVDTQLQLARLGDKAVPALIEAQRHPAEKIVRWAKRQLDALGRALPSEAIQTPDHEVLADVLVAFGRVRNPDATRIIVSFASSERAIVREGARQAIALMGEVGTWQLRDSYENVMGKKPPRDWSWERTARELFREFDRVRDAAVADLFEAGRAAREKGDLDGMRKAWGELLARDPDPEHRPELVQGYLDYANAHFDDRPVESREALLRALRLCDDAEKRKQIESLLLTERASQSLSRGTPDETLVRRALEISPDNQRALELLKRLEGGEAHTASDKTRWFASGAMGLIALAGLLTLLLRKKSAEPLPPETDAAN